MYLASCKAFCVPIYSSNTYTCVHFSLKLHGDWKQGYNNDIIIGAFLH